MFVTSDNLDFVPIVRHRGFDWREHLMCGVSVHSSHWPGYQAAARFMLEATHRCGLFNDMEYASYSKSGEKRQRFIQPKSFPRLALGELKGAQDAYAVLLRGFIPTEHTENENFEVGGEASLKMEHLGPYANILVPRQSAGAHFVFPLDDKPMETAADLIQLAADILGAEYAYSFIRDELCFPSGYACGIGAPLGRTADADAVEIDAWARFAAEPIWTGPWPKLRDLYQINLLSERHTAEPVAGLGRLHEWIAAEPGRGALKALGGGQLLWSLTDAEIVSVRPILNDAGLLLSCKSRVYRDLPPYPLRT